MRVGDVEAFGAAGVVDLVEEGLARVPIEFKQSGLLLRTAEIADSGEGGDEESEGIGQL